MLAPPLRLNRKEGKHFFNLLIGGASDHEEFTFQTLDDDQTRTDKHLTICRRRTGTASPDGTPITSEVRLASDLRRECWRTGYSETRQVNHTA